jgi:hypothetical protein
MHALYFSRWKTKTYRWAAMKASQYKSVMTFPLRNRHCLSFTYSLCIADDPAGTCICAEEVVPVAVLDGPFFFFFESEFVFRCAYN